MQARTQLAAFVPPEDHGLDAGRVRVSIRQEGPSFTGHLELTEPGTIGTTTSERDVRDEHCSDVIDALALITSLAIDPNATVAPIPTSRPAPPPSPIAVNWTDDRARPPLPPAEAHTHWSAGASFFTVSGVAPDALAGASLYGEAASVRSGWLAPSVRLGVTVAGNGVFQSDPASFVLAVAHADACPVRLEVGAGISARACLGADAGVVSSRDGHTQRPTTVVPFWLDVSALARVRWSAPSWFFAEIDGGLLVPLRELSFETETLSGSSSSGSSGASLPPSVVHKVSPAAVVADFGVGVRFP